MPFNDLFSSAKGPGVIGMIMALIVLIGFGLLFMFALDEGSQGGGKSLASLIRDNTASIEHLKSSVENGNAKIASAPQLKEISSKLHESNSLNKSLIARISAAKERIKVVESEMAMAGEEWEDYKNEYRAHVRSKAEGTTLPELRVSDGTVYVDVDIRKVSAIGMNIRHRDGFKRIGFEELPLELQDHYQFDKDQMIAQAQREADQRHKLSKDIDAANKVAEERMADYKAKQAEKEKQKTILEIATMESKAKGLEGEIQQLEQDIVRAEAAAAAARAAGKMHLNKSGSLRGTLSSKRNSLTRLKADILRMRSSIE